MRVAQVMTVGAATIHPDASIREAARMMLDHRISGLPVVDDKGALMGIVTEGDLLREGEPAADRPRWLKILLGREELVRPSQLPHPRMVKDVMTAPVVTVSDDTPVHEVVDLMERHGIKRMPVVRDKKIIGIVSRADLLRGLALEAKLMPAASAEDFALRERVLEALATVPKIGWSAINVLVKRGSVELRGATTDPALQKRLVAAARDVTGVNEINDRLVVVGPESGRN